MNHLSATAANKAHNKVYPYNDPTRGVKSSSPDPAADTIQRNPGPNHLILSLPVGGSGIIDFVASIKNHFFGELTDWKVWSTA